MINTYYSSLKNYLKRSENKKEINWFDIPKTMYILIKQTGKNKLSSVRKLISHFGKDTKLNEKILGILISSRKGILKIKFPINLDQSAYARIYALMISEGSIRTEFSLNVPEKEFHKIFEENLKQLISNGIKIKKDTNHNFERSRAPTIIRNLIPLKEHLPLMFFKNREYARDYLKIAFEAEGCPIYNLIRHKKYLKLSRNSNISELFKKQELPPEKRIFINDIKKNYPAEYEKMINSPPSLILGEHLLLKKCFDIDSNIQIECIRLNKIGNRKGKISIKWTLYIYGGEDINKFYEKIGFLSENKKDICKEMLKNIPSRKKQYFALEIMRKVGKDDVFLAKDFNKEMKKIGYTSPAKFIWDYQKNKKIIKRIGRGKYALVAN